MSTSEKFNARCLACDILYEVIAEQRSMSNVLSLRLEEAPEKDQAFIQELCFGTARWYGYLSDRCKSLLKRPMDRKDMKAFILMQIGAYQVLFMRTPDHAAINETVDAAERLGFKHFKGLINAILRKLSVSEETIDELGLAERSFPEWMQAKLKHNWPEQASAIFEQSNQRPPMCLRVNTTIQSRETYLQQLKDAGIDASKAPLSPTGIYLASPCDVNALPDFSKGAVSVQDEAAQLCTQLLDLASASRVLDACAAPGGKTCAILESHPALSVTALDSDASRLNRVFDNIERLALGSENVHIVSHEAQALDKWWNGVPFDRILLDAPCSASGVIRRHPDIKLLRKQEDLKNLAELQLHLLKSLWQTLKSGGKLVYATCSIFPQENSRVIERFLNAQEDASLQTIEKDWGVDTGFGRQLFPQNMGHDGFFYACLHKA